MTRSVRSSRLTLALAAHCRLLAALGAMACSEPAGPDVVAADEVVQLSVVTPTAPTGEVGRSLDSMLVVRFSGTGNRPIRRQLLSVRVDSGNGSASSSATTDDQGIARIEWQLGIRADSQRLIVMTQLGRTARLVVGLSARPGPAKTLVLPDTAVSLFIADTLLLRQLPVASDSFGNRIPTAAFTWSAQTGDAAAISAERAVGIRAGTTVARVQLGALSGTLPVRVLPYVATRLALPVIDVPDPLLWSSSTVALTGTSAGVIITNALEGSSTRNFWRQAGSGWTSDVKTGTTFTIGANGTIWLNSTLPDGPHLATSSVTGQWAERALPPGVSGPVVSAVGDTVFLRARDTLWRGTPAGWSPLVTGLGGFAVASGSTVYDIGFSGLSPSAPSVSARRFADGVWSNLPTLTLPAELAAPNFLISITGPALPDGAFFGGSRVSGPCSCVTARFLVRVGPAAITLLGTRTPQVIGDTLAFRISLGRGNAGLPSGASAVFSPGRVEIVRSSGAEIIPVPSTRRIRAIAANPAGDLFLLITEGTNNFILRFRP